MAGIQNKILFGDGVKIFPSTAADISNMQEGTTSLSDINFTGSPEGAVSANPGSLSRDPVAGKAYLKVTGTGNTGWSLISTGTAVTTSFATDSGTAVPAANVITFNAVSQAGSSVKFTGAGSTVSLNVTDALLNSIVGNGAGNGSLTATHCTGIGYQVFNAVTSGGSNTAIGYQALKNVTTGATNIAVGAGAGSSYTTSESNNICIGNTGTIADSAAIRIGTGGTHTTAFLAGVSGITVANQALVTMNTSTGQLGTTTATGQIIAWVDVTGTTQTIAVSTGYYSDNAGTVTFALPATANQFDVFKIVGVQGAWTITQAAGQQIKIGNTASTLGATGSISSTNAGDCITCRALNTGASTIWRVVDSMGNITVV